MALRNEDKVWIRAEIQSSVALLKPHGWRKAVTLLRELGPIATIIGVFVALIAIVVTLGLFATNSITKNAEFRTHTEDRLTSIEATLNKISSTLEGNKLKQIGSNPVNPQNIAEAKNVLTAATASKTNIDPSIVKDVGIKFVEASQKDPAAWDTALAFLNYKSSLDISAPNAPTQIANITTTYTVVPPPGEKPPEFYVQEIAPKEQAAVLDHIGIDQNAGKPTGFRYIFGVGGAATLDGMQLKNVVFRNVHVVYHGGPVIMQNVYFVDCVFDMERKPNGEGFANAFLQSAASTTFTAV